MNSRPYRVLFLCTGNSARSVMAESVLNRLGAGQYEAYSAGSTPIGVVNPLTIELLEKRGYPTAHLRSKSWSEFAGRDSPAMDAIITVCDNAAVEGCPAWPGQPAAAHWSFEDPAAFAGTDDQKRQRFEQVYQQIHDRIETLVASVEPLGQGIRDARRSPRSG